MKIKCVNIYLNEHLVCLMFVDCHKPRKYFNTKRFNTKISQITVLHLTHALEQTKCTNQSDYCTIKSIVAS